MKIEYKILIILVTIIILAGVLTIVFFGTGLVCEKWFPRIAYGTTLENGILLVIIGIGSFTSGILIFKGIKHVYNNLE
jgi:hypothetical protein